jgi:hypothetical protein
VTRPAAIAPALDIAPISPAIRGRARNWMSIKLRALSGLILRIEAGETREAPARPRIVAGRFAAPGKRDEFAPEERLPRGFGWMCGFGPHVRQDGAAFAAWLGEPAMLARVLAAPQQMARVVSPILHATGVPTPEWLATLSTQVKSPLLARVGWGGRRTARDRPRPLRSGLSRCPPSPGPSHTRRGISLRRRREFAVLPILARAVSGAWFPISDATVSPHPLSQRGGECACMRIRSAAREFSKIGRRTNSQRTPISLRYRNISARPKGGSAA